MDLGLKDKVAIVGGASQGVGLGIACSLAQEGATVVMWARRDPALDEAAERLRRETGVEVVALLGDVRRPEDHDAVVAATLSRFGRLDILVNTPATSATSRSSR